MSLFSGSPQTKYNNRIKKSFPEDYVSLRYFHVKSNRETPLCICREGSITVEAAIVIPLFAGFFSFILFYFQIMQVQISVQGALEQTGRILAVLSEEKKDEVIDDLKYLSVAKAMIYSELKEDGVTAQFVKGGALGVSLLDSEFSGDYILLKANYVMKFPIKLFGSKDFLICQKARFRKWIGWHGLNEASEEEMVYITAHGGVYHLRKSCPYLELSVRKVLLDNVMSLRNTDGEKYEKCELCAIDTDLKKDVYVTDYGNKYHFSVTCSGLKRIIYQKKFSEVGGVPGCRKCSK